MDRKAGDTRASAVGEGVGVVIGASVQPRVLADICVTGCRMSKVSVFLWQLARFRLDGERVAEMTMCC